MLPHVLCTHPYALTATSYLQYVIKILENSATVRTGSAWRMQSSAAPWDAVPSQWREPRGTTLVPACIWPPPPPPHPVMWGGLRLPLPLPSPFKVIASCVAPDSVMVTAGIKPSVKIIMVSLIKPSLWLPLRGIPGVLTGSHKCLIIAVFYSVISFLSSRISNKVIHPYCAIIICLFCALWNTQSYRGHRPKPCQHSISLSVQTRHKYTVQHVKDYINLMLSRFYYKSLPMADVKHVRVPIGTLYHNLKCLYGKLQKSKCLFYHSTLLIDCLLSFYVYKCGLVWVLYPFISLE